MEINSKYPSLSLVYNYDIPELPTCCKYFGRIQTAATPSSLSWSPGEKQMGCLFHFSEYEHEEIEREIKTDRLLLAMDCGPVHRFFRANGNNLASRKIFLGGRQSEVSWRSGSQTPRSVQTVGIVSGTKTACHATKNQKKKNEAYFHYFDIEYS